MFTKIDDFDKAVEYILAELRSTSTATVKVVSEWNNELFELSGKRVLGEFVCMTSSMNGQTVMALRDHVETTYPTRALIGAGSLRETYWLGFNLSA